MKILITGGAGFIGASFAVRAVEAGNEVHLLDNFSRGRDDGFLSSLKSRTRFFNIDLTQPDALADFADDYDQVHHYAAILGVENVFKRPYPTLVNNVKMLDNTLALASRQRALKRFVFTSTSEIYAGSQALDRLEYPTDEDSMLVLPDLGKPRTAYMLSKAYGESMVRLSGVPYTIVRPHNVYGPRMGMDHVIPQLLQKAFRQPDGGELEIFSPDHTRTFCYIDDAVDMLLAASNSDRCRNVVVNLGTQKPEVTMAYVGELIAATVGKKLRLKLMPVTEGSPSRRCPHMQRMLSLTGLQSRVSLEEGVRRTFEWYRDSLFLAPQP